MSKTVLVTGTSLVPDSVVDQMIGAGFKVERERKDYWTEQELDEALKGANAYLIGGYEEPSAANFERTETLEAVAWVGTDYKAYVPGWKRAFELGIAFINTPGANSNAVAEFTIKLMLDTYRPGYGDPAGQEGGVIPGLELAGKTLGIIGLGRIGGRVGRIAALGFGMNIVYSSRSRLPSIESALGFECLDKEALLRYADVVSLHRPGVEGGDKPELGLDEFALMKSGSVLINTVKYSLVDLKSLRGALEEGRLRAAAFDGEGQGDDWDSLVSLGRPRFFAGAQMGFNTVDANLRASQVAVEAVIDVMSGRASAFVNNTDYLQVRAGRG